MSEIGRGRGFATGRSRVTRPKSYHHSVVTTSWPVGVRPNVVMSSSFADVEKAVWRCRACSLSLCWARRCQLCGLVGRGRAWYPRGRRAGNGCRSTLHQALAQSDPFGKSSSTSSPLMHRLSFSVPTVMASAILRPPSAGSERRVDRHGRSVPDSVSQVC